MWSAERKGKSKSRRSGVWLRGMKQLACYHGVVVADAGGVLLQIREAFLAWQWQWQGCSSRKERQLRATSCLPTCLSHGRM